MRAILSAIGKAVVSAIDAVLSLPFAILHAMTGGRTARQQQAHEQAWAFQEATAQVTDAEREQANRKDAAMARRWCADKEMGRPGDMTGLKRSTAVWLKGLDQFERRVVGLAHPQSVRNHLAGFMPMRAIPRVETKDFDAFRRRHKADRTEIEGLLKREVEQILDGTAPLPEPPGLAQRAA